MIAHYRKAFWPCAALIFSLALPSCRDGHAPVERPSESSLETAAQDAGVIVDSDTLNPVGSYARRHENGLHELCIAPAPAANDYVFGMIAELGAGLSCQGRGRVSGSADTLRFVFDGVPNCAIDAHYDGEGIRLSGKVPSQCAALCSTRATFAGLSVLRSGWSRQDARRVRARHAARGIVKGEPLCG